VRPALFALLVLVLAGPVLGHPDPGEPPARIVVSGTGTASAVPDAAELTAGAAASAPSAGEALARTSAVVERLRAVLEELGVPDAQVQTAQLDLSVEYRRPETGGEPREVAGYRATHVLRVRLTDLDLLGRLLDQVVAEGANVLRNVRFLRRDPTPTLDDARRRAVADARRKAELLAAEAGVRLGRVLRIEEASPAPRPFARAAMAAEAARAVPVSPGELELEARVSVTYAIAAP